MPDLHVQLRIDTSGTRTRRWRQVICVSAAFAVVCLLLYLAYHFSTIEREPPDDHTTEMNRTKSPDPEVQPQRIKCQSFMASQNDSTSQGFVKAYLLKMELEHLSGARCVSRLNVADVAAASVIQKGLRADLCDARLIYVINRGRSTAKLFTTPHTHICEKMNFKVSSMINKVMSMVNKTMCIKNAYGGSFISHCMANLKMAFNMISIPPRFDALSPMKMDRMDVIGLVEEPLDGDSTLIWGTEIAPDELGARLNAKIMSNAIGSVY